MCKLPIRKLLKENKAHMKVYAIVTKDAFGWEILDVKQPLLMGELDDVKEYARGRFGKSVSLYERDVIEVEKGFGAKRSEINAKIDALSKEIAELRMKL
jgi:hypothetical protein